MAVFSTNQVRHVYVAKELKTGTNLIATDAAGSILPKADTAKSTLYFQYMSPGGIVSSDKIAIENVMYAKATKSEDLAIELDRFEVTLDPAVNGGNPIAGQDYLLKLYFREYVGISPEDTMQKYGVVHAAVGVSASDFYKTMAMSVFRNTSREVPPLVNVYLKTATDTTQITPSTKPADLTGTYTAIIIEQVEQAWKLGTMPVAVIPFTIVPDTVVDNGDNVTWGKVTKVAAVNKIENGKNIADLEYFCIGFRGDTYRGMGYPHIITTTYLADASKKYDVLDIHYSYIGSNESVQKSEKTMTIVAEDDGAHTAMKALITKINSVSGLAIVNFT